MKMSSAALAAGAAGSLALAILCNPIAFMPSPGEPYALSRYFTPISVGYVLGYVAVAFFLGWRMRRPKAIALGMLLPLLLAVAIEIMRDRTTHNLIPFEALFLWLPGFLVAFAAAYAGGRIAGRCEAR